MSANAAALLRACIVEYERQRDDATHRLAMAEGKTTPNKAKIARYRREAKWKQQLIDQTAAQLQDIEREKAG